MINQNTKPKANAQTDSAGAVSQGTQWQAERNRTFHETSQADTAVAPEVSSRRHLR